MFEKIKELASKPDFKKDYTSPEETLSKRQEDRKTALEVVFARIVQRMRRIDKLVKQIGAELVGLKRDHEEVRLHMSTNCNNRHDYKIEFVISRLVQHINVFGGLRTDKRIDKAKPLQSLEDYANGLHFCTLQELDLEVERRHASR